MDRYQGEAWGLNGDDDNTVQTEMSQVYSKLRKYSLGEHS